MGLSKLRALQDAKTFYRMAQFALIHLVCDLQVNEDRLSEVKDDPSGCLGQAERQPVVITRHRKWDRIEAVARFVALLE